MSEPSFNPSGRSVMIVGASRGLGYAMAAEFVKRGWDVTGTVRNGARTPLHDLADAHQDQVRIEILDIDEPDQIEALRDRMTGRRFDMLFVNAGTTTHDQHVHVGMVSTDEFMRVMITNALSPMRVIEALQHLVPPDGLIGAMSSGQGSIANNETGMREVYRGSKAALNMFMRSFAARKGNALRSMLLLAPGWIRTDLGGPDAPFGMEEVIPMLADVMIGRMETPGLRYLDRFGQPVPW